MLNKGCSAKNIIVLIVLCVIISCTIHAQLPYTIDITNDDCVITDNFLKMGTSVSSSGETLSYNSMYLVKNGKPWFPVMGEMHFQRTNENDWEESVIKMKAAGIEIISSYLFWNYVEEKEGVYNWDGNNNLKKFLALCKKHHMYVWLRIGPWVHAETRNGGFPDWLMSKGIPLRKNDSTYLAYVKAWYTQIAKQCNDDYFKQNGPVIGLQIENEYVFTKREAYEHMKALKTLALQVGFDVPYYSAFAQGPDGQNEFLYTTGAYPDSPWNTSTKKVFKTVFFIKPLEADPDIGSDLFGKVDTRVRNTYPKISAELGSGMQVTYHRRVDVSAADIAATMLTRIASGLNGLGYYMFHGGMNPAGKNLQESRVSGYPNDLPFINYDFQAPVGAMNIINDSYGELKLINTFIQNFGSQLCTQKAFFPAVRVQSPYSNDTVQCAVRAKNNSGFIFLSNYQRHVNLPAVKNFQLHLNTKNGLINIPEKPVTINANSYNIWPYNLQMHDVVLHYATAQPLCILNNAKAMSYVFFGGDDASFVFDVAHIASVKNVSNCTVKKETNKLVIYCDKNKISAADILTSSNKKINIIFLPKEEALHAQKVSLGSKEMLVTSNANIFLDSETLMLEKVANNPVVQLSVYPNSTLLPTSQAFTITNTSTGNVFGQYLINIKTKAKGAVTVVEHNMLQNENAIKNAQHNYDSIISVYGKSDKFDRLQPGPLYQYNFHNLPAESLYQLKFKTEENSLVKDWMACINYSGDALALYKDNKLVYDQFNYNDTCKIKLSYMVRKQEKELLLQLLPLQKDEDIYTEDNMLDEKNSGWMHAQLKSITLQPVYQFKIRMR